VCVWSPKKRKEKERSGDLIIYKGLEQKADEKTKHPKKNKKKKKTKTKED